MKDQAKSGIYLFFDKVIYSLPIQLLFHHVKKNLALLFAWVIVISAISGGLGRVYGIHYLFLDPEYLGKVSFLSFYLVGIAFGNLTMAWHITCYILDSHKFRFIGVLERPFTKFSLNNSIIPVITLMIYIVHLIQFQLTNEFAQKWQIIVFVTGLFSGILTIHILFILYFKLTNKDIFRFFSGAVDMKLRKNLLSRDRVMNKWREFRENKYRVKTYIDLKLRVRSTKGVINFGNREAILKVFDQNHFNSVMIELIILSVILLLGFFMENHFLQIPAAASAMLVLAIIVMLVGAISYWFKGWGLPFALLLFVLVNLSVKTGLGKGINEATGLNYDTLKASYSMESILEAHSKEQYIHDQLHMRETLEKWKSKFPDSRKEKMVFLCSSGGGQRAALWTLNAMIEANKVLDGKLMDQTFLITGASGGLVGAAYFREMFLNERYNLNLYSDNMLENMGKDNLNPIIFSFLVNDLFFKIRSHTYHGRSYNVDRGFTFEQTLNKNFEYIFDKTIADYSEYEKSAIIPTLIMSPTIANDGRKLYIASQPVSFMGVSSSILKSPSQKIRGVDFQMLFKNNNAEDLRFLSALRMSASFPYITPNISLPTEPRIEIMDAGISDNFGVSDALRFINVFKEWIAKNTNGVILLVIRDSKTDSPVESTLIPSVIDRLTYPIASVYNNMTNMQDINNDVRAEVMQDVFKGELDVIEIAYDSFVFTESVTTQTTRASLSWHLTTKEKRNIIDNIQIESNQQALQDLKRLVTDYSK